MADTVDFVVVGKGMMGAAAARHLTLEGASVALVGPDEPANWQTHDGVFASHYDNGRITRTIDADPDWARLAQRSIERYRAIEADSGIPFYTEAGCLVSGPVPDGSGGYLDGVRDVVARLGLDAPLAGAAELSRRFPYFGFAGHAAGYFEQRNAGYINPRAMVAAQVACVERAGGRVIREQAVSVSAGSSGVEVRLRSGDRLAAGRVLVAAGGFSRAEGLLPVTPDLVVKARTVVFAAIEEADLPALSDMPSWIDESGDPRDHFYLLPPIRYPDGRFYVKIGGDPTDILLPDDASLRDWFRTEGDAGAIAHLKRILGRAMPGLRPAGWMTMPCVTTYTVHGNPYAGYLDDGRIGVLTGGNGAAAKSSDEIGRLGARLLLDGRLDEPGYVTDFALHVR